MCRLLIIPGIKKDKYKAANKFVTTMATIMSKGNDDGLGYAAVDHNGNLFGERWWYNDDAFVDRNKFSKGRKIDISSVQQIKELYKDFISLQDESDIKPMQKYNSFGNVKNMFSAITLHTRMATSGKEFENTHPFIDKDSDTSLVHNGVIRNHSIEDQIRSTCDSERILNKYIEHEVMNVPSDIQNMIDELKGYFACGIFSRDSNGNRILDIFRTRANLSAAFIKELETIVFSTKLEDIEDACYQLNFTIVSKCNLVKEDMLLRLNPITGEPLFTLKYTDTTNKDSYTTNTNNNNKYWSEQYWNNYNDTLYEKEYKKWESQTSNTNNVIGFNRSEQDHQKVTAQEEELMVKGLTLEGARQEIKESNMLQPSSIEVNEAAIEEINKLIENNSIDDLNENEASIDDWFLDEFGEMWIKKTGSKF